MANLTKREKTNRSDKKNIPVSVHSVNTPNKPIDEADDADTRIGLRRRLGLIGAISMNVGTIIGSGIFVSPKGVVRETGSIGLSMTVWTVCGIVSMLGGLCYAELGTLIRRSGGDFAFLLEAYGGAMAFMYVVSSNFITSPSSLAIMPMTCGQYLMSIFYQDECGNPPEILVKGVAILLLLTLTCQNVVSMNAVKRIQIFFTIAKVAALVIIIVGGIYNMAARGQTTNFQNAFEGSETNIGKIARGFYSGMWAYNGWQTVTFVTEEVINPRRNIPLSIILSVLIVTVVYILTNISYFTVMSTEGLLDSPAVAMTWAQSIIPAAPWIISLAVAVSTFGSTNGSIFSGSRTTYRASRDQHLPSIFGMLHIKFRTPVAALVVKTLFAIIFTIPSNIDQLIDLFGFIEWTVTSLVMLGLLILRYKYKDVPRSFKVPIVIPVFMLVVSLYLVIAPLVDDPRIGYIVALVALIGSLAFYFPFVYFGKRPAFMLDFTAKLQLFFQICPSELKDEPVRDVKQEDVQTSKL